MPAGSEEFFKADLLGANFLSGVDRGRWRLHHEPSWPTALIAVSATPRVKAPDEYVFLFELTGYPNQPPTAKLWDTVQNCQLLDGKWPGGTNRVQDAFNPAWQNGCAIYIPCDRLAISTHPNWITEHPGLLWSPRVDITQYLWILYDLLHSTDYSGIRCP